MHMLIGIEDRAGLGSNLHGGLAIDEADCLVFEMFGEIGENQCELYIRISASDVAAMHAIVQQQLQEVRDGHRRIGRVTTDVDFCHGFFEEPENTNAPAGKD